MSAIFPNLPKAQFGDVKFPWEEITINGVLRDYIHEFPHTPTGKPEKMGRKNYEISFSVPFFDDFPLYPNLWSISLPAIVELFETEKTLALVIPIYGTINCYIRTLRRTASSQVLSGERVELLFIEDDNPDNFVADRIIEFGDSSNAMVLSNAELQNLAAEDSLISVPNASILSAIDDTVNLVVGVRDQADIYGDLLEAKALRLQGDLASLDAALSFNTPNGAKAMDALQQLWSQAISLGKDVQNKKTDLRIFTTPSLMSMPDVSTAIYGDTTHTIELLQINPVADGFAIPPNTQIKYYPVTA